MVVSVTTEAQRTKILTEAKAIAIIGYSPKPDRPSYQIGQFLKSVGYQVYPINPSTTTINGQPCYANLAQVPDPIDIINVFRRSEHLPTIVEDAIHFQQRYPTLPIPTLWTQLGIYHALAAQIATDAGLTVIMDRCIKVDYIDLINKV